MALLIARFIINFLDGLSYVLLLFVLYPIPKDVRRILQICTAFSILWGTWFYFNYILYPEAIFIIPIATELGIYALLSIASAKWFNLGYKRAIFSFFIYQLVCIIGVLGANLLYYLLDISISLENITAFIIGSLLNLLIVCLLILVFWLIKPIRHFPKEVRNKYYLFFIVNLVFISTNLWTLIRFQEKSVLIVHVADPWMLRWLGTEAILYFIFMLFFTIRILRTDSLEHDLQSQKFYNHVLESSTEELRRLKHNYDNSLAVIYGYVQQQDYSELAHYLEDISGNYTSRYTGMTSLLNVQNAGLRSILSTKLEKARQHNIDVSILVHDKIQEIKMRISDICELTGILLDNAIEAAVESPTKQIRLELSAHGTEFRFVIENYSSNPVAVQSMRTKGWSTKGNDRGLGLWIADKIIRKYRNAVLNLITRGQWVQVELIVS